MANPKKIRRPREAMISTAWCAMPDYAVRVLIMGAVEYQWNNNGERAACIAIMRAARR